MKKRRREREEGNECRGVGQDMIDIVTIGEGMLPSSNWSVGGQGGDRRRGKGGGGSDQKRQVSWRDQ